MQVFKKVYITLIAGLAYLFLFQQINWLEIEYIDSSHFEYILSFFGNDIGLYISGFLLTSVPVFLIGLIIMPILVWNLNSEAAKYIIIVFVMHIIAANILNIGWYSFIFSLLIGWAMTLAVVIKISAIIQRRNKK